MCKLSQLQTNQSMRIAISILIGIHGIIHLFGFLKAFELSEFNAISQHISKAYGIFWLFTFILFILTLILYNIHFEYWWLPGFLSITLSQVLIFNYWSDAKFGSIANLIILLAVIIGYSSFSFKEKIKKESLTLIENTQLPNQKIITKEDLLDLPPVVQKWLKNSGIINKQPIYNLYLNQELQLKMTQEQTSWNDARAEQYFSIQPPAFNWNINTEMNSILKVAGRDKFENGKGEMLIKLLSLIPIAVSKDDKKIHQATLQRYLAEIVWFPTAALSGYIQWENVDRYSARATMRYKGIEGSGIFYFDEDGNFKKFVARRYQNADADEPKQWTVTAKKTEVINDIKIPTACEASWKLNEGEWTWLKLRITGIKYNIDELQPKK